MARKTNDGHGKRLQIPAFIEKYISRETLMYLIVGVLVTVVGLASFYLVSLCGFHIAATNTISTVIAIAIAFIANKLWVFESKSMTLSVVLPELIKFVSGRALMYFVETGLLVLLVSYLGLGEYIAKAFTSVVVVIGNYFISKKAVFIK